VKGSSHDYGYLPPPNNTARTLRVRLFLKTWLSILDVSNPFKIWLRAKARRMLMKQSTVLGTWEGASEFDILRGRMWVSKVDLELCRVFLWRHSWMTICTESTLMLDYQREKIWSLKQQEELLDSIANDIDIRNSTLLRREIVNSMTTSAGWRQTTNERSLCTVFQGRSPNEDAPLRLRLAPREIHNIRNFADMTIRSIARRIEDYDWVFVFMNRLMDEYVYKRDL